MTDTLEETQNLLAQLKDLSVPRHRPPYADTAKALMQSQNKKGADLSDTSPSNVPNAELSTVDIAPVPFELWETLAYDIALANTDPQTIAKAYNITTAQLDHLQENQYFTKILQAKKDEVKQLGSDATFAVKMRMVANHATPQLLRRLTDPSTASRDFLAMFKTVTELGQLIPLPKQEESSQMMVGANVTFNISGVPGLDHLVRSGQTPLSTTAQYSQTVVDAEFNDVVEELSTRQNITDGELEEL